MRYIKLFESKETYTECSHEEYEEKVLGNGEYVHMGVLEYANKMWEEFTNREIKYLKKCFKEGIESEGEEETIMVFGTGGKTDKDIYKHTTNLVFPTKEMPCGWHMAPESYDLLKKGLCYIEFYSKSKTMYINTHGYAEKIPDDGIIKNPYMIASILKFKDGWYYVGFNCLGRERCDSIYKCDQWDSLKECLKDKRKEYDF